MTTTQQSAAIVLAQLVAVPDLPRLTWRLTGGSRPELIAQPLHDTDDERTAAIRKWAAHFGAEVEVTANDRYTSVEIRAEVDGVPVVVFTHTDRTHTYVAVPVDQAGGA